MTDYKQVFEALPYGRVLVDGRPPFNLINITDHQLRVLGVSRGRIVGKPLFETFPEPIAYPNKVKNALYKVLETKDRVKLELLRYDIPDFDGKGELVRYWSCEYIPIINNGEVTEIIITAMDITEAVESEGIDIKTIER